MKYESVQGYLISRAFISMYKEDGNQMTDDLSMIYFLLTKKLQSYSRKSINLNKEIDKAWKKFTGIAGKEDVSVQAIPFCLRLIIRNPVKDKRIFNLAISENRKWLFKKDEEVVKAKKIVDEFYNLSKDKK